jgi:hypothetical protein
MTRPLLLTAGGPRMAPLLRCSVPTFERFASLHGYDVEVATVQDGEAISDPRARRRMRWSKVELLRVALERRPHVLWMDADAMFLRYDRDIVDDMLPDRFQGLVLERFPTRVNPNTGVWLLRRSPAAVAALEHLVEIGLQDHSWADQAALCVALGWRLGDHHGHGAGPGPPTVHRSGTCWLPSEWNPTGVAVVARPRVLHPAGGSVERRYETMLQASACDRPTSRNDRQPAAQSSPPTIAAEEIPHPGGLSRRLDG